MPLTTIPEDEAVTEEPLRPRPIGTYMHPETPPMNPFAGTADLETTDLDDADDFEAIMFA